MVLSLHVVGERTKGACTGGDGLRTAIQFWLSRWGDDFSAHHASLTVHGDDHRQITIELAGPHLRKLLGTQGFDLASQAVVVLRVAHFARGRAEIALARACILGLDALLDFGQHLQQLSAAGLRGLALHLVLGGRQLRQLSFHLREQQRLLGLQGGYLLLHRVQVLSDLIDRRMCQG